MKEQQTKTGKTTMTSTHIKTYFVTLFQALVIGSTIATVANLVLPT